MPSPFIYCQLSTNDYAGAKHFYAELFGWRIDSSSPPAPEYTELYVTGEPKPVAGIMPASPAGASSRWIPVIEVSDVDVAAQRAQDLGGTLAVPPVDIPGKGRHCVIVDLTEASVALFKPVLIPQ